MSSTSTSRAAQAIEPNAEHFRQDGVRITHDPFAPGMAEKYGQPGETDNEGFDPYGDSVGAGIYGGIVKRNEEGEIVIGRQYQGHNPRPGPVYAGGGYTPSTNMLDDVEKLVELLQKYPDLVNDVTTGGAQPLHMSGMSRGKQLAVGALVERGADIEALDTYGMTPLMRMASNNLAAGAKILLEAGADISNTGKIGESPMAMAQSSRAQSVIDVLKSHKTTKGLMSNVVRLNVMGSNVPDVNGDYLPKDPSKEIPKGFDLVCRQQDWDTSDMWMKLNGVDSKRDTWFAHTDNDSYIYWNKNDGKWWIDGPDGNGVWIVTGPSHAPPAHGWMHTAKQSGTGAPMVRTFREL